MTIASEVINDKSEQKILTDQKLKRIASKIIPLVFGDINIKCHFEGGITAYVSYYESSSSFKIGILRDIRDQGEDIYLGGRVIREEGSGFIKAVEDLNTSPEQLSDLQLHELESRCLFLAAKQP